MNHVTERIQVAYPKIYLACHRQHSSAGSRKGQLSERESRVLHHLTPDAPLEQGVLATHLGIQKSTLSELLDVLCDRGLVVRERQQTDRRRVSLCITLAGRELRQQHSLLDNERLQRVLDRLNAEERAHALSGIELLAQAASELQAEVPLSKDSNNELQESS